MKVSLAFLPVLFATYGAAYYGMVTPGAASPLTDWMASPKYPIGGRFVELFFEPAHLVDLQLRPDDWSPRIVCDGFAD